MVAAVSTWSEIDSARRTLAGDRLDGLIAVGMDSENSSMWLKIELAGLLYGLPPWLLDLILSAVGMGSAVGRMGSGNSSMWSKIEGPRLLFGLPPWLFGSTWDSSKVSANVKSGMNALSKCLGLDLGLQRSMGVFDGAASNLKRLAITCNCLASRTLGNPRVRARCGCLAASLPAASERRGPATWPDPKLLWTTMVRDMPCHATCHTMARHDVLRHAAPGQAERAKTCHAICHMHAICNMPYAIYVRRLALIYRVVLSSL